MKRTARKTGRKVMLRKSRIRRRVPRNYIIPRLQCKRMSFSSTWAFGTVTTNDFWRYYTFTAGDINNFGDFSALFDEYRIRAIKVTFRPAYDNVAIPIAAGAIVQPQAYAHINLDPESVVIPSGTYTSANMNTFLENSGVFTKTLRNPFSIYFKPKVSDQLFGGGTASTVKKSTWIKTSETTVQHRGFHMFLQQNSFSTGNTNIKLDTFYTFYLDFRNLK